MTHDKQLPQTTSTWRDVRLQKALEHAPDAHIRPSETTRKNILRAAQQTNNAINNPAKPKTSWLDRLAQLLPRGTFMPLAGAFACLTIFTCAYMLWPLGEQNHTSNPPAADIIATAPTNMIVNRESNEQERTSVWQNRAIQITAITTDSLPPLPSAAMLPTESPETKPSESAPITSTPVIVAQIPEHQSMPFSPNIGIHIPNNTTASSPYADYDATVQASLSTHQLNRVLRQWTSLQIIHKGTITTFNREQASAIVPLLRRLQPETIPLPFDTIDNSADDTWELHFYTDDNYLLGRWFLQDNIWHFIPEYSPTMNSYHILQGQLTTSELRSISSTLNRIPIIAP